MIASGLALILIPIAAVLRHRHGIHRAAGRAAAACVVAGGAASLLVACGSEATLAARAGLFAQGVVWLALMVAAIAAIRRGLRTTHARLMIAMAAAASGAIWLRLVVNAALAAGLPFDPVYATAAWICWLVPLALAAWLMHAAGPQDGGAPRSARRWSARDPLAMLRASGGDDDDHHERYSASPAHSL